MTRSTSLLCSAVFVSISGYAQRNVPYASHDYTSLSSKLEAYYDSLATNGDTTAFNEGGDYAKFRKWNEFWGLRLKPGATFEDYFQAYAACLGPGQPRSGNMGDWHELGPFDLPSGTVPLGTSGYGVGPIRFLTMNSDDPDKMLCGAHRGGLFYTDDAGMNWWNAGSDAWDVSGCQYAVFNAEDTDTWYAANHGFNAGYWGYSGAIRRTTDQGNTWDIIADHSTFQHGGVWTKVNKLVSDHTDTDILFAATEHRLWKTADVNAQTPTWSAVTIAIPPSVLNDPVFGLYNFSDQREVYDLEMDPTDHDKLFATVCFHGQLSVTDKVRFWRLMRSFDGGVSWSEMPNTPNHPFWVESQDQENGPPILTYRNARYITLENTRADHDVLYILYNLQSNTADELWKITNATNGSWSQSPIASNLFIEHGAGNGFGVSQHDPNVVFVSHRIRYRVYDNGMMQEYTNNYMQYHVDIEDMVGHPDNDGEVWIADHGGVHRSTDNGATWEWRGNGLAVAEVYRMATSYSEPQHMILGLYHDGNVLSDGSYGNGWQPEWKQLGGLDGQIPLIDPIDGNWMFWSSQNGLWKRSQDRGVSPPTSINPGVQDWDTEGTMDRKQPNIIHIAAWPNSTQNPEEVRRSMNRGNAGSFETISDFNSILGDVHSNIWRVYPAWPDPEYMYVHMSTGQRLYRTTMARGIAAEVRDSWMELEHPRPDMWIGDIGFDHDDPNICYIAYSSSAIDQNTAEGAGMLFRVDYSEPEAPLL